MGIETKRRGDLRTRAGFSISEGDCGEPGWEEDATFENTASFVVGLFHRSRELSIPFNS